MTLPSLDAEFYLSHSRYVRALARRIVFDPSLADDVEQQTWLAALERAPREGPSARAWLASIARNFARKSWLTSARREQREQDAARAVRAIPTPAEIVEYESARRRVVEALLALDEPYRTVLFLRFFEELEPREIAARLRLPVETVRTRVKRGLERMRVRLQRGEPRGAWGALLARALRLDPPRRALSWNEVAKVVLRGALWMSVAKKLGLLCAAVVVLATAALLWTHGDAAAPEAAVAREADASLVERARDEALRSERTGDVPQADAARPAAKAASETAPAPAANGSLLVRVTWSDGTPAAGVGLRVFQNGAENFEHNATEVTTGADGTRRIDEVAPGLVVVEPDRGGYGSTQVDAGEQQELAIEIPRGADVDGLVTDALERPVAGADVFLHTDRGPQYSGFVVARSDEEGRFRIRSVLPHSGACLCARARGRAPTAQNVIASAEGATLRVHLVFAHDGGRLEGRVVDPDGRGIAGASVLLGPEESYERVEFADGSRGYSPCAQFVRAGTDGRFVFDGVALQVASVQARASGFACWRGEVDSAHATSLEIRLQPTATLRGTVVDEDGATVFGALVMAEDPGAFEGVITRTESDGSYVVRDLPVGEVALVADGLQRGKTKTTLVVAPSAELRWDAKLARGLTLTGRIVAGDRALDGWLVHLSPRAGGAEPQVANLETDTNGHFEFRDCADQEFDLSVYAHGDISFPLAWREHVRPGAGEIVVELDLSREPSARLLGRVVDVHGNAIATADVTPAEAQRGPSRSYSAGSDGRFEAGPLPPGEWSLEVRARGFAPIRTPPRALAKGEALELGDIAVDVGGTIRARLERAAGLDAKVEWIRAVREDETWSEWLQVREDEALSGPLSAGRWRLIPLEDGGLELAATLVEVRTGVEVLAQVAVRRL